MTADANAPAVHGIVDELYNQRSIADDDQVMAFVTWRGTHTGPFHGAQPTSKPVTVRTAELYWFDEAKVIGHADVVSNLELLEAAGAIERKATWP